MFLNLGQHTQAQVSLDVQFSDFRMLAGMQYWYTRNVPVFTNTGTFQYLGPEVYFFLFIHLGLYTIDVGMRT